LNAGAEERSAGSHVALYMGIPAVVALVAMVLYILAKRNQVQEGIQLGSFVASTADLAKSLFTDYLLPFEVTSVLVLIAIMGAVVLARREH